MEVLLVLWSFPPIFVWHLLVGCNCRGAFPAIRVKIQKKSDKNTLTWCFPDCRLFLQLTAWPPGVWKLAHVSKLKNLGRIIWSNSAKTVLVRRILIQTRSLENFFRSASWTQVPQNDFWGVWDQHINHSQRWDPYFCRPMRIWEYVCPVKGSWIHLGGGSKVWSLSDLSIFRCPSSSTPAWVTDWASD